MSLHAVVCQKVSYLIPWMFQVGAEIMTSVTAAFVFGYKYYTFGYINENIGHQIGIEIGCGKGCSVGCGCGVGCGMVSKPCFLESVCSYPEKKMLLDCMKITFIKNCVIAGATTVFLIYIERVAYLFYHHCKQKENTSSI